MSIKTTSPKIALLCAALVLPTSGALFAQDIAAGDSDVLTTVYGTPPADLSGLEEGPEVEGFITARSDNRVEVMTSGGQRVAVMVGEATEIKASGGFLGLGRTSLGENDLLNGLPVEIDTVQWGRGLVASKIQLKNKDLKTASMIRNGTVQGFAEQTAATEALRGRLGDIDQYNVKGTTNVYFDTGMASLSPQDKANLCATAAEADGMDNALMLVVGYTDSTGSQEFNQQLSEKRAGRVVNYLQQACGWKPYRMLTPTGMAEADPAAPNDTAYGKSQNRRVAVNILVSKSVDGI
ncbi:OmpA family protein [Altererythrobacter luteolus]|uniref:OmpA family protein n=1 Tax=Pontixanthobacter luteolus TaxID=295089 RepID=A0A6I4V3H5_9SPHN|nr:OmpA family protein [Pontixanthobacter luteolus]MXP47626.1 OmpA family protein [Pontixanthobacter luteolus]